jgi:hypothetical protein
LAPENLARELRHLAGTHILALGTWNPGWHWDFGLEGVAALAPLAFGIPSVTGQFPIARSHSPNPRCQGSREARVPVAKSELQVPQVSRRPMAQSSCPSAACRMPGSKCWFSAPRCMETQNLAFGIWHHIWAWDRPRAWQLAPRRLRAAAGLETRRAAPMLMHAWQRVRRLPSGPQACFDDSLVVACRPPPSLHSPWWRRRVQQILLLRWMPGS